MATKSAPANIIEHNDGLWVAVKIGHVKPGKGGAFAQVELKNLRNGSKLNERFRSADKVEKVRLEQKDQQFLFESDGMLTFMDSETFEQVELDAEILGERRPFLQDGMDGCHGIPRGRGAFLPFAGESHLRDCGDGNPSSRARPPRTASNLPCSTMAFASWCRPL